MRFLRLVRCCVAIVMACAIVSAAASASAQDPAASQAPAHISFVQGFVTVAHGDADSEPAVLNMPVVQGDRVITGSNGRAEITLPDGSAIEIDPASDVEMLGPTRVRVHAGTIEHRAAAPIDPRSPSAQNLPPDLQQYGPDLDQSGSWQYEPQYGSVWYPTTVTADWRPYYDGYWYPSPAYGYSWIGAGAWAWPTHHYGRWGYGHSRWFWIPGRVYAPAWVSWSTAPGYVGWCPLGWDNRAVVALSTGYWGSDARLYSRGSDPRWTVMSRDHFGSRGYSPRRDAVDPSRIASNVAFVEHRTPPARERRGSFSVGGNGDRSNDRASDSVGVAVPRYRQREAGGDSSPRVPAPVVQAPVAPTPTLPPSNENDHPAYRPRYQPRYEPRVEPAAPPAYRDRRMGGDDRRATTGPAEPRAQERERQAPPRERPAPAAAPVTPPAPAAPAPAPAPAASRQAAPSSGGGSDQHERGSGSPARERSPDSRSTGTATRRPR